jgi:uncharacterized protein YjiS (DUF1127 family)
MTRQQSAPDSGGAAEGPTGNKVLDLTRRAWSRYWTRRAAQATVAMLHALDDRALKDIGLDRSEIESVVDGGRKIGNGCGSPPGGPAPFCERRIEMSH